MQIRRLDAYAVLGIIGTVAGVACAASGRTWAALVIGWCSGTFAGAIAQSKTDD